MKFYERAISDFGGYEKCKDILSQPNIDFIMNAQGLREHMLEYRRQHNIFENGDWVVYEITGTIGDFIDHIKLATGHPYCRVDFGLCDVGLILLKHIRHATDEEIAAGKRLEVDSE